MKKSKYSGKSKVTKKQQKVKLPTKSNQLVRIARLINHKSGNKEYGLMVLRAVVPDHNHIYFQYVTKYTGNRAWALKMARQYGTPIEELTK